MAAVSALDELAREVAGLPDGAMWPKGSFFKKLVAALIRDRVRAGANVDEIPSDKGRFFNAQAGGTSAAADVYPWQQYASKWLGTGSDPNPGDRKLRFRLRRGKVAGLTPANMMQEFVAFGSPGSTNTTEAQAVRTQVYLKLNVQEQGLGSGNVTHSQPILYTVQGDTVPASPNGGSDGSLPSYLILPICELSWWGGTLHFEPGVRNFLSVGWQVSGTDCEHAGRSLVVSAY